MMALWGGRFEGETDPLFRAFNDSLVVDYRLVQEDIEGSIAWAHALVGAEVLSHDECDRISQALRKIAADAQQEPYAVRDAGDEDVHSFVERELIARVGDLGKKLHTGRSRNDQVATDFRLWTRTQVVFRRAEIHAAQAALIRLARREEGTIFPGYTHLQRAQPVLFSHWCLAYFEMFARDDARFEDAAVRANICPLGAAALAGTAYPIDREAVAASLGFARPAANSLDAVSDRDFVLESLAACAICSVHLSRMAEDLIFFASGEAGFVELDDAMTSGSSIMPQKKNPDALELVRGKTGRILGSLVALCTTLKGLPLAYNKDMQEDKEPLFDAMDNLSLSLRVIPRILDPLRVNRERTREAAEASYSNATELADYLVSRGVPFREAHEQVGRIVREAIARGISLDEFSIEELASYSPVIEAGVRERLPIEAAVNRRDVLGGTAPSRVRRAIDLAEEQLAMKNGKAST